MQQKMRKTNVELLGLEPEPVVQRLNSVITELRQM